MGLPLAEDDDDTLIDLLVRASRSPMTFLQVGDVWDRAKASRGKPFSTAAMALVTSERNAPGGWDLRAQLATLLTEFPPLRQVARQRCRRDGMLVGVGAVGAAAVAVSYSMSEIVKNVVMYTGVPGLALLVLLIFVKPLAQKMGMSKMGVKATERLILVVAVGLLLIGFAVVLTSAAPGIIRAIKGASSPAGAAFPPTDSTTSAAAAYHGV
jgi:hypothetical protein